MTGINLAALLMAISIVESNQNDDAVGKAGERGRYQITKEVWQLCAPRGLPFQAAHIQSQARRVAEKHITRGIIPGLKRAGRKPEVWSVAACWNAGLSGYLDHDRGITYGEKVYSEYRRIMEDGR